MRLKVSNPVLIGVVGTVLVGTGVVNCTPYDRCAPTQYEKPIRVSRVIDGDTAELANGDRVRYIGIDTPEEFDERKPVQCFAHEAAAKNKELVEGKRITLQKDISQRDQYGRYLGYIYLEDGTFVNKELVRLGYAFAYPFPPDVKKSNELRLAEREAREGKRGLWSGCEVHTLSSGRKQTNAADSSKD